MVGILASAPNPMANVTTALEMLLDWSGKCFTFCVENPVLCIFIAGGVIGVAITALGGLKGVASK